MKIFLKTFGCRTNIYDSELIKSYLQNHEVVDDESQASCVIINSCTVTNGADSDVRHYINSLKRQDKKVILTGCGAFSKGKELYEEKKIFGVFGASKKDEIEKFLAQEKSFFELGDLKSFDKNIVKNYENHTKAFIKIQEGCDFNCSYCIIPSVRGKSRSINENLLLEEAKILLENGFSELVLTGTNIGSYGKDSQSSLGKLIQKLAALPKLKRLRLGSIEPSQIDESFREILEEKFLERHLHIALQHTSPTMLKIMRRRNQAFKDLELFNFLAEKGFALGTDFIVGHPGESEELWQEALQNFKNFPLTHLHAFIYSPRENTHSASLKSDVNGKIAKIRLKEIKKIVDENNLAFRKKQGKLEVLLEQKIADTFIGYDQFYNKIKIQTEKNILKNWIEVENYERLNKENFAQI